MAAQVLNEYGIIKIENEIIAKVAGLTAMDCYGVVGMGARSVKSGLVHLLKRESLTKGIYVSIEEDAVTIDIHIIVEYGTNIGAIGETLVDTVIYKVKEILGLVISRVNIFVVGVRV